MVFAVLLHSIRLAKERFLLLCLLGLLALEGQQVVVVVDAAFSPRQALSPPAAAAAAAAVTQQQVIVGTVWNRWHLCPKKRSRPSVLLFLASKEEGDDDNDSSASLSKQESSASTGSAAVSSPSTTTTTTTTTVQETPVAISSNQEKENKYPLDIPSPILLGTSMVLAIASVGSLFELLDAAGEAPKLGFVPTTAIAVLGLPLCGFLFYAAILKATAETEEDDQAFLQGK